MANLKPTQVKEIRKKLGLTQIELAERLGVDRKSVIRWETGESVPHLTFQTALKNLK